jgi:8-oxo-dGTP pyrophosphatase MutT (NUDIX family)
MVGAGLLPVALHKGCVYLLFGRENELNDTPGWADFGGGTKPKESLLDAAAREGSEELNGLLGSQSQLKKIAVKKKITELKYDAYTTIVFKTHYDNRLEEYYLNNYKFFEKYLPSVKKNAGNGLLEKAEIKWFTFGELRKNKSSFRKFYQHMVDVILANEDIITKNLMKMKCGAKCDTVHARRIGVDGTVSLPRKHGRKHTITRRKTPSRNNRRVSRRKKMSRK